MSRIQKLMQTKDELEARVLEIAKDWQKCPHESNMIFSLRCAILDLTDHEYVLRDAIEEERKANFEEIANVY